MEVPSNRSNHQGVGDIGMYISANDLVQMVRDQHADRTAQPTGVDDLATNHKSTPPSRLNQYRLMGSNLRYAYSGAPERSITPYIQLIRDTVCIPAMLLYADSKQ